MRENRKAREFEALSCRTVGDDRASGRGLPLVRELVGEMPGLSWGGKWCECFFRPFGIWGLGFWVFRLCGLTVKENGETGIE